MTALAAGYSATIEVLRYALVRGRVSSIDDVLVNTADAVLGALLVRGIRRAGVKDPEWT